nr:hypothetical protein [uncultured Mediterraneibacter sp.]
MKRMQGIILTLVILVLCIAGVALIMVTLPNKDVIILDDKSFLEDVAISEDNITISCIISIENKSESIKTVSIDGKLQESVKNAVLKDAIVKGKFTLDNSEEIVIAPKEIIKNVRIIFETTYSGKIQLKNRELPKMEVIYVK